MNADTVWWWLLEYVSVFRDEVLIAGHLDLVIRAGILLTIGFLIWGSLNTLFGLGLRAYDPPKKKPAEDGD